MSMYEGGKPTAVKTLGTQIGAIFEGKVGRKKSLLERNSLPQTLGTQNLILETKPWHLKENILQWKIFYTEPNPSN